MAKFAMKEGCTSESLDSFGSRSSTEIKGNGKLGILSLHAGLANGLYGTAKV
ncbi:hypothetical protein PbB2_02674 [Candidatus Phycosocius bacilliformis]|uniref:Uncharacterized protein n=1 Tax=Candidatus Phycosocius bacilliformis TaxID=1445552 RepID=A0A2P2ED40_9PROT|nr:hypothetical protein PbB2_02674 [Candidatus Phycosocius bacilliformis]